MATCIDPLLIDERKRGDEYEENDDDEAIKSANILRKLSNKAKPI